LVLEGVPPHAPAVPVERFVALEGVRALVDDAVLGLVKQLVERDG